MRKLLKKKVNIFGKTIPVFVIVLLGLGLVSAALIGYFGVITGSVVVTQGLFLDDKIWSEADDITYVGDLTSLEEKTVSSGVHTLWNKAKVDAEFGLVTTCVNGASAPCGDNPLEDATPTVEYLLDADLIVWDASKGYIDADFAAGREVVTVILPEGTTLGNLRDIDFEQYVISGYPASVNILLDVNGDSVFDSLKDLETGLLTDGADDVLKIEWAHNPMAHYAIVPPYTITEDYNNWFHVFKDSAIIDDSSIAWLYTGKPGAPGEIEFNDGTLAEWKVGKPRGTTCWYVDDAWKSKSCNDVMINKNTLVYGIQIETLGFIAQSSAKVRNIKVNDDFYEISGLPAGEQTDFEVLTDFPKMILPDVYTITTRVTA